MSEKRRGNFISLWTKITQKYDNTEQNMLTRGNSATETMFIIEKSFEKKGKIFGVNLCKNLSVYN